MGATTLTEGATANALRRAVSAGGVRRRYGAAFITAAALISAALSASSAEAQEKISDFTAYKPIATAVRIDRGDRPVIDADLSDPAWRNATPIDGLFYRTQPDAGVPAREVTDVYILFDDDNLYFGFYAHDSEPGRITANSMQRDFDIRSEDLVWIILDSMMTKRDGFLFALNPNGARLDGVVENNAAIKPEWNAIWEGDARIAPDGWIAEFAIPFRSISFDPGSGVMGMQLVRAVRRVNDFVRWSNIERSKRGFDLSNVGELHGVAPQTRGLGLDAQALVTINGNQDWRDRDAGGDLEFIPGLNLYYKLTPSLTASATLNSDFSDAPLDQRQVNTGRFSLFFPETRDFFLQDIAAFEFAGRVFAESDRNGMPFFSRRIGLAGGVPAGILGGAKVSGHLGPISIGALTARTEGTSLAGGQQLSVVRMTASVLEESRAGFIFTEGDPLGEVDSAVAGADVQYRNSALPGGSIHADLGFLRSWRDSEARDFFGSEVAYVGDVWNATMRYRNIEDGFDPRLGFVNRTGITSGFGEIFRVWRPRVLSIREMETALSAEIVTDMDGRELDREWGGWAHARLLGDDEFWMRGQHYRIDVREPFSIAGIASVAAGRYAYTQYEIEGRGAPHRKLVPELKIRWGGIYDGDYLQIRSKVTLQPSKYVSLAAEYDIRNISLPSEDVEVHVASAELNIYFSTRLQMTSLAQYDNISEGMALSGQVRWEIDPATEFLLILRHSATVSALAFPGEFESLGSSVTVRLGRTFRM